MSFLKKRPIRTNHEAKATKDEKRVVLKLEADKNELKYIQSLSLLCLFFETAKKMKKVFHRHRQEDKVLATFSSSLDKPA